MMCPFSNSFSIRSPAYYGIIFKGNEEAAFSNFRLLEAVGSVTAYVLSPMLCTGTKLVVLGVLMVVGMIGFTIVERIRCREEAHEKNAQQLN